MAPGLKVDIAGFLTFLKALFPEPQTYLRELVQNAMEALNAADQAGKEARSLKISMEVDADLATLTLRDTGCGLTGEDLVEKLGTVFRTGWGDQSPNTLGVGQFGFGFYSSLLVSEQITIRTRALLGGDRATAGWIIDCSSGQGGPLDDVAPMTESGFEVVLHLKPEYRSFAASAHLDQVLRGYLLFCPYQITIAGAPLTIQNRAAWHRMIADPDHEFGLREEVQCTFGWSEPPMAILPFGDGILAATPAKETAAPASRVYRQGVFVLETEIIPKPLNYIFCGIFNVDDLNIRPDRTSFLEDHRLKAFQQRILTAAHDLLLKIDGMANVAQDFYLRWHEPTIGSVLAHDALKAIRSRIPLHQFTGHRVALTPKTSWENLQPEIRNGRVLYTTDPVADRQMLDFFQDSADVILAPENETEKALLRFCANDAEIRLVEVSECYLESQRQQTVRHPDIEALFAGLGCASDCEIVCVKDTDARVPIRLMSQESPLAQLIAAVEEKMGVTLPKSASDGTTVAIVNLSHPALKVLVAGLESGASQGKLETCATVLILSARMGSTERVSSEAQIALAIATGNLMADALGK